MKAALTLALVAGCSHPAYLGADVPKPCTTKDAEGCLGWMAERDLAAAELDIYGAGDEHGVTLRRYVQSVTDRVARGSLLGTPPRVLIADRDETYATSGRRIVIARRTLEKLGSEAELAAVIAHELAHVEGHHGIVSLFGRPVDEGFVNRRDAESIADERAVWLLERAGYAPTAMGSALRKVLEAEDDEHPLRADRIARVTVLAGGRAGFEGRDRLYDKLANMVVGRDPRLGRRVGDAWVVSALGIAVDLEDGDVVRAELDVLALRRDRATLMAYAVGAPWGRELAALLEDREIATSESGPVTLGALPFDARRDDGDRGRRDAPRRHDGSPLGKLARAVRSTLPQPPPGSRVAIAIRPRGALVIEIGGRSVPNLRIREATSNELAQVTPARLVIARAPRAGKVGAIKACAYPVDDLERVVAAGDPIKCADRAVVASRLGETRSGG